MSRRRSLVALAALGALVAAGGAAGKVHRVQRGETLDSLARRYGVSVSGLVAANGIGNPDHILAGSQLTIPVPGPAMMPIAATRPAPSGNAPATLPPSPRPVVVRPDRAHLAAVFDDFARRNGVPADLVKAMAWQESGWQSGISSSTRAVGVMQLMPDTVEFVSRILLRLPGNLDPRDPTQNIRMGVRFYRYLLQRSGGNVDLALAAYYQGLRSVTERGIFPDTARYVANVKALRPRF